MSKPIWNFVTTDLGDGIECSNCKHKIEVKDALVAERGIGVCPFCGKQMDMESFDYDRLFSLAASVAED